MPAPIHLAFASDADCHVKAGWIQGAPDFAVKIASGSYRNAERGLPTNHGLVCVLSAETGEVRAILADEGRLTAWRTAAAGALVTDAMARPDAVSVGVFGTGGAGPAPGRVAGEAARRTAGAGARAGRREGRLRGGLPGCAGLSARAASAREAAGADMVITTTPATSPVLDADAVQAGAHVTGIGTDMPHKNELPAALFARAGLVATDDHDQCLDHGDFAVAVRAGAIGADADVSVGTILRDGVARSAGAVTVADLTGVGALDAAVASLVTERLLS